MACGHILANSRALGIPENMRKQQKSTEYSTDTNMTKHACKINRILQKIIVIQPNSADTAKRAELHAKSMQNAKARMQTAHRKHDAYNTTY